MPDQFQRKNSPPEDPFTNNGDYHYVNVDPFAANRDPQNQAGIDHFNSANPYGDFGLPGRQYIDDPFEVMRQNAIDQEEMTQMREFQGKLVSDIENIKIAGDDTFSKPLAEKLLEENPSVRAILEVDLTKDRFTQVHIKDEILWAKVNDGDDPRKDVDTGIPLAKAIAKSDQYFSVYQKAFDELENDPTIPMVIIKGSKVGKPGIDIAIMRPRVDETVAELRHKLRYDKSSGKAEPLLFDPNEKSKAVPMVTGEDGKARPLNADEIQKWRTAYPGEYERMQKQFKNKDKLIHATDIELGTQSSRGSERAKACFSQNKEVTAVVTMDLASGKALNAFLNPDVVAQQNLPAGADPRFDADLGFAGAASLALGKAHKDILKEALDLLRNNPNQDVVLISGESLGQPGKDVALMRPPLSKSISDLRKGLRYDGTSGIIDGYELDPAADKPAPMIKNNKGVYRPLTEQERAEWEQSYPGEQDRFEREHQRDHKAVHEGERKSGALKATRSETEVAQGLMTEYSAIGMLVVLDPKTGEPTSFHSHGRSLEGAQLEVAKRQFNPSITALELQKFSNNPAMKIDVMSFGSEIMAVVNRDKLDSIFKQGDITQVLKEGFPAPLGKDGNALTADELGMLQMQEPAEFDKWIEQYKAFAMEMEQRDAWSAETDRRVEGVITVPRTEVEVASNLLHDDPRVDFAVVFDPKLQAFSEIVSSKANLPYKTERSYSVQETIESSSVDFLQRFDGDRELDVDYVVTPDNLVVAVINKERMNDRFTTGDIQGLLAAGAKPMTGSNGVAYSLQQLYEAQQNERQKFKAWIEAFQNRNDLGEIESIELADSEESDFDPGLDSNDLGEIDEVIVTEESN